MLDCYTGQVLNIIRDDTKTPGEKPDFTEPIILGKGSTLEDAAADVHKDFAAGLKYHETETFGNEPVHPNLTGHLLIAEAVYKAFCR